jgi:hypothetical protein
MKKLLSRYRKSLIWNSSLVAFSFLAYLTTHLYKATNLSYNLLPIYPLLIAFLIIFAQTGWHLYLKLITRIQLIDYTKTSHYCLEILNDNGDVSTRTLTKINNISSKSIEWLPEETFRLSVDPGKETPFEIKPITPNKVLKTAYFFQFNENIDGREVYNTTWRPKVEPAIKKGEEFQFEWLVNRIEKAQIDAFKGTDEFHIKIAQYYETFSAEIIAPPGYKFSSVNSFVVDLNENRLEEETNLMTKPILNQTKNILTIEQNRPRPLTIYKYLHSLEPV